MLLPVSFTLTGASDAEQIGGARVSGLFFTMLGASILHGRAFSSMVLVQALAPVVTGMSAGFVVAWASRLSFADTCSASHRATRASSRSLRWRSGPCPPSPVTCLGSAPRG